MGSGRNGAHGFNVCFAPILVIKQVVAANPTRTFHLYGSGAATDGNRTYADPERRSAIDRNSHATFGSDAVATTGRFRTLYLRVVRFSLKGCNEDLEERWDG
jgi:hypothetical protein